MSISTKIIDLEKEIVLQLLYVPLGHRKTQLSPPPNCDRIFAKSAKPPALDVAAIASKR